MPSGRTILVLLILAAGLGGFFYYDTYSLEPRREKAESAKGRIWTVEPKDVEAVTVARKGETLRLKRAADGGWDMLEPVKTRGDRAVVDDMVTGLATARMDREIDPNPAKPADFGLDPPEAEVKLEVKGRAEPLVLRVGSKNPTGVWVYAREGAKPAVFTLSESIARDASRPVADFRDHTVIAFDRQERHRPRPRRQRRSDRPSRRRAGQVAHRQAARAERRHRPGLRVPRQARGGQGHRVRRRRPEVARALRPRQARAGDGVGRPRQGPRRAHPAGRPPGAGEEGRLRQARG